MSLLANSFDQLLRQQLLFHVMTALQLTDGIC
ncbi:hypothetical protein A359_02270 [secondary endosymbiont of Ctenarytaina eucalypti]|uniref:Uncharacterized protein n=1 Tax=secondary endosymbiont of Ctenarytaina eucalypti TaxID=1199245 RepID=J3YRF3_9ENTR|nr:hypothetical protein A359_02270 [secondary endosymbiont of Ctenarytaina eucalypti]